MKCPACSQAAWKDYRVAFEVRPDVDGRRVRRCRRCGAGLAVRRFGRARVIPEDIWGRMEAQRHPSSRPQRGATSRGGEGLELREFRIRWVLFLLVAGIVIDIAWIAISVVDAQLLGDVAHGRSVSDADATALTASENRRAVIGPLVVFSFIATVIAFLSWFYRAYKNLPRLGARNLRYASGWAIGAWFVPILNLYRPKQIANDIWRASDPELPPSEGQGWNNGPVSPLLHWWWALWIIPSVGAYVAFIASYMLDKASTVEELQLADLIDISRSGLYILSAVLAILVVRAVTRRQEMRAERLGVSEPPREKET